MMVSVQWPLDFDFVIFVGCSKYNTVFYIYAIKGERGEI